MTQLVFGVLRRRKFDALVIPFMNRPPDKVQPEIWDVLHLALLLAFLTHIPPHAAVHESVELVGSFNAGGKGLSTASSVASRKRSPPISDSLRAWMPFPLRPANIGS